MNGKKEIPISKSLKAVIKRTTNSYKSLPEPTNIIPMTGIIPFCYKFDILIVMEVFTGGLHLVFIGYIYIKSILTE